MIDDTFKKIFYQEVLDAMYKKSFLYKQQIFLRIMKQPFYGDHYPDWYSRRFDKLHIRQVGDTVEISPVDVAS
jgi:hypothetical protein